jgi:hypothetical protein
MSEVITTQPVAITTDTVVTEKTNEPFTVFPATSYTFKVFIECYDRPLMTDDEVECCNYHGEPFCAHCSCLWFPFAFVYDVVSCPFRGIKHCVSK